MSTPLSSIHFSLERLADYFFKKSGLSRQSELSRRILGVVLPILGLLACYSLYSLCSYYLKNRQINLLNEEENLEILPSSVEIEEQGKSEGIIKFFKNNLNKDTVPYLFSYLDLEDLEALNFTNPKWSTLCNQKQVIASTLEKTPYLALWRKLDLAKKAGDQLTKLDLNQSEVTDQELEEVLQGCPNIQELSLIHCEKLTHSSISKLQQYLKNLKSLNLKWCLKLTNDALLNLPSTLEVLELPRQITGSVIKSLPRNLRCLNLKSIVVEPNNLLDLPTGLRSLVFPRREINNTNLAHLPKNLEYLELDYPRHATLTLSSLPQTIKSLKIHHEPSLSELEHLPKDLEELFFFSSGLTNEHLKKLPPNLKKLTVIPFALKKIDLSQIDFGFLPKGLESLCLQSCRNINVQGYHHLPNCLQTLELDCSEWTSLSFLRSLTDLEKLTTLNLTFTGSNITDDDLKQLPDTLKSLRLVDCNTTGEFLKSLPKDLSSLCLTSGPNLSDDALSHLPATLRSLVITGSNLSDDALSHLPTNLRSLVIVECNNLTGKFIPDLPIKLDWLRLRSCKNVEGSYLKDLPENLKALELFDNDNLGDADLHLPPRLRILTLERCNKFTKAVFGKLPKSLRFLNIPQWTLTDEEKQQLSRKCQVWADPDLFLLNLDTSIF